LDTPGQLLFGRWIGLVYFLQTGFIKALLLPLLFAWFSKIDVAATQKSAGDIILPVR
jgi:hypothetical protein